MILYEHEGKTLLRSVGIATPNAVLLKQDSPVPSVHVPVILKAQVLSGNRAKHGGIIRIDEESALDDALRELFSHKISNETVANILIEEFIEHDIEYYVALSYDTTRRAPVLIYSSEGGTGIEGRTQTVIELDPRNHDVHVDTPFPAELLRSIVELFFSSDCLLLEINPLVLSKEGATERWVALDAKIHLDDAAAFRHSDWIMEPRTPGREPNERERAARKIDEDDYRGTAGASYIDLDGDIAILASGGGASLLALDALYKAGGRPANYVEYSGNPPREKVEALARIVLSKPGIKGLWIVGAVANFTDIYTTLSGVISGIKDAETSLGVSFDFPIVIRRGGPREAEAFAMLREMHDKRFHLFGGETSIPESARTMVSLAYSHQSV